MELLSQSLVAGAVVFAFYTWFWNADGRNIAVGLLPRKWRKLSFSEIMDMTRPELDMAIISYCPKWVGKLLLCPLCVIAHIAFWTVLPLWGWTTSPLDLIKLWASSAGWALLGKKVSGE